MEVHNNKINQYRREDQQDAWEAYSSFRAARTLFFVLLLFGLLVAGSCFWIVNMGLVDDALGLVGQDTNLVPLSLTSRPEDNLVNIQDVKAAEGWKDMVRINLRIWNYVMTFSALLFCLTMLIGLKLALVGRLGGLAPAGKAFFMSLVVMVMVVPWQTVITREMPGAMFSYEQLVNRYFDITVYAESGLFAKFGYYGRFLGLWGLAVILLLMTFSQSRQAVRKIKARMDANLKPEPVPVKEPESIKKLETILPARPSE